MQALRGLLIAIGALAVLMGLLWIGQGTGLVLWPASSFMLADMQWAINGAVLALVGLGCLFIAVRKR